MLLIVPLRKAEDNEPSFKPYRAEHTDFEGVSQNPRLLASWNKHIQMHPSDYRDAMMGKVPLKAHLEEINDYENSAGARWNLTDEKGNHAGTVDRVLGTDPETGDKVAHHMLFMLEKPYQRKGYATEALRSQMEHYQQRDVKRVYLTAGLDNGGYTWARMGARPDEHDTDFGSSWRRQVKNKLDNPGPGVTIPQAAKDRTNKILQNPDHKAIWDIADQSEHVGTKTIEHPSGDPAKAKTVPLKLGEHLLSGADWFGHFDLEDPEAMGRFHNAISRKQSGSSPPGV